MCQIVMSFMNNHIELPYWIGIHLYPIKHHNQRMEKRGRGISFDFPSTLYGDPRAALYEGERSPISPKDSEARVGEFT